MDAAVEEEVDVRNISLHDVARPRGVSNMMSYHDERHVATRRVCSGKECGQRAEVAAATVTKEETATTAISARVRQARGHHMIQRQTHQLTSLRTFVMTRRT